MGEDPRLVNKDRDALLPCGLYLGGEGMAPSWLVGRRMLVCHVDHFGTWFVALRVLRGVRVVDELPTAWDATEVSRG